MHFTLIGIGAYIDHTHSLVAKAPLPVIQLTASQQPMITTASRKVLKDQPKWTRMGSWYTSVFFSLLQRQDYLKNFGYLEDRGADGPLPSAEEVRAAVSSLQSFMGLPVTGDIDQETAELMARPRCGVRDFDGGKRYSSICTPNPCKWADNHVTYV